MFKGESNSIPIRFVVSKSSTSRIYSICTLDISGRFAENNWLTILETWRSHQKQTNMCKNQRHWIFPKLPLFLSIPCSRTQPPPFTHQTSTQQHASHALPFTLHSFLLNHLQFSPCFSGLTCWITSLDKMFSTSETSTSSLSSESQVFNQPAPGKSQGSPSKAMVCWANGAHMLRCLGVCFFT